MLTSYTYLFSTSGLDGLQYSVLSDICFLLPVGPGKTMALPRGALADSCMVFFLQFDFLRSNSGLVLESKSAVRGKKEGS
jgi:hypothetical protein